MPVESRMCALIGDPRAIWFGVMWCLWSLWSWVLPQVYVGGPKNVVAPGFWLFAACWTLAGFIGRVIFGRRSK